MRYVRPNDLGVTCMCVKSLEHVDNVDCDYKLHLYVLNHLNSSFMGLDDPLYLLHQNHHCPT